MKDILNTAIEELKGQGTYQVLVDCLQCLENGQKLEHCHRLQLKDLNHDVQQMVDDLETLIARKDQDIKELNLKVSQIKVPHLLSVS